jgi:hypothetical protein
MRMRPRPVRLASMTASKPNASVDVPKKSASGEQD